MTKHFRATHKETKEVIEFGLEDLKAFEFTDRQGQVFPSIKVTESKYVDDIGLWLRDYNLEYRHKGKWFKDD